MKKENRENQDVKKVVDKFVVTLSELESLLAQETDYLKVADRKGFMNLQDKKMAVAQTYQKDVFAVKNVAKTLKSKYPKLVPYLQEKQEKLSGLIKDNENALIRMENSARRLSDRIMDVARQAAVEKNSLVYGAAGQLNDKNRASMGVSESA